MAHHRRYEISSVCVSNEKENWKDSVATTRLKSWRLSAEGVPDSGTVEKLEPTKTSQLVKLPHKKENVRKNIRSKVPGESPGSERAHKVVDEDQCDQCAMSKEVQCSQSARNKDELELIASIKQLAQYGEREVGKKSPNLKKQIIL